MELKVGDKVRWIKPPPGPGHRPVGTRGKVTGVGKTYVMCTWERAAGEEEGPYSYTETASFIKEFQPGDRVVRTPVDATEVKPSQLGTIEALDRGHGFYVKWDNFAGNAYYLYSTNKVAHAPSTSPIPIPPSVPTIPAIPPPPPVPQERGYGRCYFCHRPDSEWLRDRYTCDDCMERYR